MRIIVGRDYYDSGMAYGHDQSCLFVRSRDQFLDTKVVSKAGINIPAFDFHFVVAQKRSDVRFNTYQRTINHTTKTGCVVTYLFVPVCAIICAKMYRGFKVRGRPDEEVYEEVYFWNEESFTKWVAEFGIGVVNKPYSWMNSLTLAEYFDHKDLGRSVRDWLIDHKISILTYNPTPWIFDKAQWRVNGDDLKEMQFFKVIDPVSLFQNIEMWVGGILPSSGNPMVEITDNNIKVAKHGFDKYSFRKPKESR